MPGSGLPCVFLLGRVYNQSTFLGPNAVWPNAGYHTEMCDGSLPCEKAHMEGLWEVRRQGRIAHTDAAHEWRLPMPAQPGSVVCLIAVVCLAGVREWI